MWFCGNITELEGWTMRPNRTRISIDIPEEIHKRTKMLAIKYNITITKLILQLLVRRLKFEESLDGNVSEDTSQT